MKGKQKFHIRIGIINVTCADAACHFLLLEKTFILACHEKSDRDLFKSCIFHDSTPSFNAE